MERKFEVVEQKFRKHPEVVTQLPERADGGSCGYDFRSCEDYVLQVGETHLFFTDVKAKMFFDNRLELNTRSGNGVKKGVVLANTIGWIDSSYYNNPDNDGNIGIALKNTGVDSFVIKKGDRIAQGCFTRYLITEDDKWKKTTETKLRQGGFGSSGKE